MLPKKILVLDQTWTEKKQKKRRIIMGQCLLTRTQEEMVSLRNISGFSWCDSFCPPSYISEGSRSC